MLLKSIAVDEFDSVIAVSPDVCSATEPPESEPSGPDEIVVGEFA